MEIYLRDLNTVKRRYLFKCVIFCMTCFINFFIFEMSKYYKSKLKRVKLKEYFQINEMP